MTTPLVASSSSSGMIINNLISVVNNSLPIRGPSYQSTIINKDDHDDNERGGSGGLYVQANGQKTRGTNKSECKGVVKRVFLFFTQFFFNILFFSSCFSANSIVCIFKVYLKKNKRKIYHKRIGGKDNKQGELGQQESVSLMGESSG